MGHRKAKSDHPTELATKVNNQGNKVNDSNLKSVHCQECGATVTADCEVRWRNPGVNYVELYRLCGSCSKKRGRVASSFMIAIGALAVSILLVSAVSAFLASR